MKLDIGIARRLAPVFVAGAAMLPAASHAQDSSEPWKWQASIYGWFPSIDGTTRFPTAGGGPSIDVSADAVLDALEFTFMGSIEAHKGKWGLFTDLIYVDFGGSKSDTRDFTVGRRDLPAGVTASGNLDISAWVWTFAGSYTIASAPRNTTDLLFGGRMLNMDQSLDWSFSGNIGPLGLPGRSGRVDASETNWDAIVGLKGVATLSEDRRWVLPYYVDVGTGQSKLTWQAFGGIGYAFDWGTTTLAWRYLKYEFDSGSPVEDISLNGPFVGVTFQW